MASSQGDDNASDGNGKKRAALRLVVTQPSLPKYRLGFFEGLASLEGVRMKLVNGLMPGAPPSVETEAFEVERHQIRMLRIFGQEFFWDNAQWRYATRKRADVLVLSWNTRYLSLVPALVRAKLRGVRTILWGHGYSKQESGFRAWLRERVAFMATALVFYSEDHSARYLARGWEKDRIPVALNALDQRPIQAARASWLSSPERLLDFQQKHGLEQGPVVLFVARLEQQRRLELLFEAAGRLKAKYPGIKVVVIGKGEYRDQLEEAARSLGVEDRVIFTGAIYDEQAIAPWFLSATVFGFPMNIGLSILHAFGYGLPVVTSDQVASQNPEVAALEPGKNGFFYKHGDVESLAEALSKVFEQAPSGALSRGAHATATEVFTCERMVEGMASAVRYSVGRK